MYLKSKRLIFQWHEPICFLFFKKQILLKERTLLQNYRTEIIIFFTFLFIAVVTRISHILKFQYIIDILKELLGLGLVSLIMTVISSIIFDLFGSEIKIYEDHIHIYPGKPDKLFFKDLTYIELLKGIYKRKSYGLIKLYNDQGLQKVVILSKKISINNVKKLFKKKGIKFVLKSRDL